MDTLTVAVIKQATPTTQHQVEYRWKQHTAKTPSLGGVVTVSIPPRFKDDQSILAELATINYLLSEREIHGKGRLGNGVVIQVSSGAIKKALNKGSLKRNDKGDTDKSNVALFSLFLATKFFEATVEVVQRSKWASDEPKSIENFDLGMVQPNHPTISSVLGNLIVTRHALNRFVLRFAAKDLIQAGKELVDVPDQKWSRAWRILEGILPASVVAEIPKSERGRVLLKHGPSAMLLHHQDSLNVFALIKEPYGWVVSTCLEDSEYMKLIKRPPRMVGGRLIPQ